jgi:hypothetical protein
VNPVDTLSRGGGRLIIPEGHLEHCPHGAVQTVERPETIRLKRAVLRDSRGDERMRELHQNRARPPKHNHPFSVDLPGWAFRSWTHRSYRRIPAPASRIPAHGTRSTLDTAGHCLCHTAQRRVPCRTLTVEQRAERFDSALNVTLLED